MDFPIDEGIHHQHPMVREGAIAENKGVESLDGLIATPLPARKLPGVDLTESTGLLRS
jgi:hypothetical protein